MSKDVGHAVALCAGPGMMAGDGIEPVPKATRLSDVKGGPCPILVPAGKYVVPRNVVPDSVGAIHVVWVS